MNARHDNAIDYIEFNATDVATLGAAKQFYESAFGWQFKTWAPGYVDTHSSGVTSGIAVGDQPPLAVIYCEDLEEARTRVLAAGATLVKDIFSFPGGRRFHFKDPAGNVLAVWSQKSRAP